MSGILPAEETAVSIVTKLQKNGFESYFAGGCVRDKLMNRNPEDFDIATQATPEEIAKLFSNTIPVGSSFGVMVVVKKGIQYEVATFRNEHGYSDGRHPDIVQFTTPEEDASRRDFTINGMFFNPLENKIIDYVNGQEDIKNKIIRAIGDPDKRFTEDRLRLMRAIRFAVRLNFSIEKNTWNAIKANAEHINTISPERIREETTKILMGPRAGIAVKLLQKAGLLKMILPEAEAMIGVEQPVEYHPEGDVFEHTCLLLDGMHEPDEILAWAAFLHDIGKPVTYRRAKDRIRFNNHNRAGSIMAEKICRRLRFSNESTDAICNCIDNHMNFMHVRNMRPSTLKRLIRRPTFFNELELHRLDCESSHGDISNWEFLKEKSSLYKEEEIRPDPLINGHDLIKAGYKPGRLFKEILNEVESLQLEDRITDKEQAIKWVLENYKRG